jgi:hypothetical protein
MRSVRRGLTWRRSGTRRKRGDSFACRLKAEEIFPSTDWKGLQLQSTSPRVTNSRCEESGEVHCHKYLVPNLDWPSYLSLQLVAYDCNCGQQFPRFASAYVSIRFQDADIFSLTPPSVKLSKTSSPSPLLLSKCPPPTPSLSASSSSSTNSSS